MRKSRLLSLLLLVTAFITFSCTKEGPEGPVGATGSQGPAGTNGTPGTPGTPGAGITTYSSWYTTVTGDWVPGYLDPNDYNCLSVYIRTAPGVTQDILDHGVILCYGRNFTIGADTRMTSVSVLPYLENFNAQHYGAISSVGKIAFTYDPAFGFERPEEQIVGIAYRYVIVAGSTAGGKSIDGPAKYAGYTADELKAMPYEQVKGIFNIPESGSNIQ